MKFLQALVEPTPFCSFYSWIQDREVLLRALGLYRHAVLVLLGLGFFCALFFSLVFFFLGGSCWSFTLIFTSPFKEFLPLKLVAQLKRLSASGEQACEAGAVWKHAREMLCVGCAAGRLQARGA